MKKDSVSAVLFDLQRCIQERSGSLSKDADPAHDLFLSGRGALGHKGCQRLGVPASRRREHFGDRSEQFFSFLGHGVAPYAMIKEYALSSDFSSSRIVGSAPTKDNDKILWYGSSILCLGSEAPEPAAWPDIQAVWAEISKARRGWRAFHGNRRGRPAQPFFRQRCPRTSAICTAFRAAPLRRLSDTHHRLMPLSMVES